MIHLVELPTEILDQIFSLLPRLVLAALCRVHTAIREAAAPLLYNSIEFTWVEIKDPPVIRLLQSILLRPELAQDIHHLKLLGETFSEAEHAPSAGHFRRVPIPKISVTSAELELLVAKVENLRLPYGPVWIEEMKAGTMDAFAALLLATLSALKSLRMEKNFTRQTYLVGNMLHSALCKCIHGSLPRYEHLKTVEFSDIYSQSRSFSRPSGRANTYDALTLFYLPALQCLDAFIDTPISGIFNWPAEQPQLSNLTSLGLKNLRETALEKVLSRTPHLKSLRWSWYCGPSYFLQERSKAWAQTINLQQLASALTHVRATLEDLNIPATCLPRRDDYTCPPLEIKGDPRFMSGLSINKLRIPWSFIAGFSLDSGVQPEEVVPQTVDYLEISDDLIYVEECECEDGEIVGIFPTFLESRRTTTARLQHLHMLVDGYFPTGSKIPMRLADLQSSVQSTTFS